MDARVVWAGMLMVMLVAGCSGHQQAASTLTVGGTVHFSFVDTAGMPLTQVHYAVKDSAGHLTTGITPEADITIPDLVTEYSLTATKAGYEDSTAFGALLPRETKEVTVFLGGHNWPPYGPAPAQLTSAAGWTLFTPWTAATCANRTIGVYLSIRWSTTTDSQGRYTAEWYLASGYDQPVTCAYTLDNTELGWTHPATVTLPAKGSTGGAMAGMSDVMSAIPDVIDWRIDTLTVDGTTWYTGPKTRKR